LTESQWAELEARLLYRARQLEAKKLGLPEPPICAAQAVDRVPPDSVAGSAEPEDARVLKLPSPSEAKAMRKALAQNSRRQWPPAPA
jgi:hypothetical protein